MRQGMGKSISQGAFIGNVKYRKAFERADSGRFSAYMEDVAENRIRLTLASYFRMTSACLS